VFREVNDRIRDVSSGWMQTGEPVGFLCECDDSACTDTVLLQIAAYDELRAAGGAVSIQGHRVSSLLVA
jgi:hypothetical protein